VGGDGDGALAESLVEPLRLTVQVLLPAAGEDHEGAVLDQALCDGGPQATARAGDDRHTIGQLEIRHGR
jgi:hypothetical protein